MVKTLYERKIQGVNWKGHKNIVMIAPGFSVDCLETLEEIKMEGREEFKEMGGKV